MNKSEQINELAAALVKVQAGIQPASKDAANPFFKSSYASLNSVWESCRALLTQNGLAVTQLNQVSDHGVIIETVLLHASGQWISGETFLPLVKHDAQSVGSATSYGRRYGLAAIVGIVADVDDDGNAASKSNGQVKPANGNGKLLASDLSGPKATSSQITLLTQKATQAGSDLQTLVSQHYGGTEVENLSKDAAMKLLNLLEGK